MKTVVLIGATQGIGRELANQYALRGDRVIITGRDADRAARVAAELSPSLPGLARGLAVDLTDPGGIADALDSVERVDRLVIASMVRDNNTVAEYHAGRATELVITKLVGYTTVVSTLVPRMATGAAVLLFGGAAAYRPYPGSTTVTAVNAAVSGMVRTMSVELAPIRVNAIHPGVIEDSPYWAAHPGALDRPRRATLTGRLGTMRQVVDGCVFLLENRLANGIDLRLDGGSAG